MTKVMTGLFVWALAAAPVLAQEVFTEHTMKLGEKGVSPAASIQDLTWLAGQWKGEGLGGIVEEAWAPPLAGTMMGMFRLVREDQISFYELIVIQESKGSLVFRVKHFSADFEAWEEKDDSIDFRLVRLEPRKAYFSGLTLHRVDEETLNIYLAMRSGDGTVNERFMSFRKY